MRLILSIGLLALTLRLGAVFAYGVQIAPELWEVEAIVNNLLSGKGFVYHHLGTEYRSYLEPLYPLLTYIVYVLSNHNHLAMAMVHVLLSTLLVAVVYSISRLTFGSVVAVWAGFLVAVDPGLIRYVVKFHPLVLDSLLMVLVVLAFLRARLVSGITSYVLLGVTTGLCVLTRPSVLAFLPFALLWLWTSRPRDLASRIPYFVLALILAVAVVSPWVVRNYIVHERFIVTRTNGPFVFWLGNNPKWSGSSMTQAGQFLFLTASPEFRERVLHVGELGQNDLFWQDAMSFVSQDLMGFVGRTAAKFVYFWWFSPQFGIQYRGEPVWIYGTFYVLAFLFAAIGLLLSIWGKISIIDRRGVSLLLVFLLSISLFQSFFYVEGRHRLGVEAIFLIFSARGIVACSTWVREVLALMHLRLESVRPRTRARLTDPGRY